MADTKILVLGFSVTAEKPGFVGTAKDEIERNYNAEVVKSGLGGLQPYHARYLFPQIIEQHAPDILILDLATPAFRNFYKDQADYRLSLLSVIRLCHESSIRLAMLDFPRTDVDYADDWVSRCHEGICDTMGIPYKRVPLIDGILRDEVHTTEYGSRYYATFLKAMVRLARIPDANPADFGNVPRYGSLQLSRLLPDRETFIVDRGGYKAEIVKIPENETLDINFESPLKICGFTALMGPRTGTMEFRINDGMRRQQTYDQFCYYERLGAFVFGNSADLPAVRKISVTQTSAIPATPLLKGEKNTQSRIGGIGHIFTEFDAPARQEKKMKFLVFGFSVTGETPGYIEKCAEICKERRPDYEIKKIGIGGLQPEHARHLVNTVLESEKPDALIVEFSTAAYRTQSSSDYRIAEQNATITSMFQLCKDHGVRCGILDLPLTDVDNDDDWVADVNKTLCMKHHVPRVSLDLRPELLWDNVHPTAEGKEVYAEALADLLDQVRQSKPRFEGLLAPRKFFAFSVTETDVKGGYFHEFSRHGYVTPMLAVPQGEMVTVALPKQVNITGMIVGIGPKTGMMVFQLGTAQQALQCYDPHSYFHRAGGRSLRKANIDKFLVAQSAKLPEIELLKGIKDTGPRTGGITHILYEE